MQQTPWPVVYKDQLILGADDSLVAICTLWTPRGRIAGYLEPELYAAIGNLYSRQGVNYLLENLLASSINTLIVMGTSLSRITSYGAAGDAQDVLRQLWLHTRYPYKVYCHYMEEQFPFLDKRLLCYIQDLCRHVRLVQVADMPMGADEVHDLVSRANSVSRAGRQMRLPVVLPVAEAPVDREVAPASPAGHHIEAETIVDSWLTLLRHIMLLGRKVSTTRELLSIQVVIHHPEDSTSVREVKGAPWTKPSLRQYVGNFHNPTVNTDLAYQYGGRLYGELGVNQVEQMLQKLLEDNDTRQAYSSLYSIMDDAKATDPPCITSIQTFARSGALHLIVYIRSSDSFRAYVANLVALASLQRRMASRLKLLPGTMTVILGSAHVYNDCEVEVETLLRNNALETSFILDRRGNIVLGWEEGPVATIYSSNGEMVKKVKAPTVEGLQRLLLPHISRVDHGVYIGWELARLRRLQGDYIQDAVIT